MNIATSQLADSQHPWIGLASFSEGDFEFFSGREEEVGELLRLVQRDTLTLLYGVSGLGKTSLLQAGLFPMLRSENYLPVPIRLDYLEGAAPLAAQVFGAIRAAADAARAEAPQIRPDETLWEYFHREGNHFWSQRNDLLTPFLAFDQFEELFTLGRETAECAARATSFISELADLVENRPPPALRDDPLRAKEFSFKPAPLKVLLSIREDYLAEIDRIRSHFRALGQNRLRLLPMGELQARQVIALGERLLAPGMEDRILKLVASGAGAANAAEITIAPALLSLVLRELNERRLARGANAKITADLLDVEQQKIFEDFYLRTVQDFPPGVRNFIEEKLLTTSGYRNSCALDDALSYPDLTQPIFDELVNRRLLAYEDRHNSRRVELTHDVLIPAIKASRDARFAREEIEQAKRQQEEAAAALERARVKRLYQILTAALIGACVLALVFYADHERRTRLSSWKTEREVDFSKAPTSGPEQTAWLEERFSFQGGNPWAVVNGAMVMNPNEWCWLNEVQIPADTQVVVHLRVPDKLESFQICINGKKTLREQNSNPPGYSCRFGIWKGSLDLITGTAVERKNEFTNLLANKTPQTEKDFFLTFQREGETVSLLVNGNEVHHETYLMPLLGEQGTQGKRTGFYENIGFRTGGLKPEIEVLSVLAKRHRLPEQTNPIVVGDALAEAGYLDEAIKKYEMIAEDYKELSSSISALAQTKLYLLEAQHKDSMLSGDISADLEKLIRCDWWHDFRSDVPQYQSEVREVEALTLWKKGKYKEALLKFDDIFGKNRKTRIVLECLQAEHLPLEPEQSELLLGSIAKTFAANSELAGLDVSSFDITSLDLLARVHNLRGLDCHKNKLRRVDPLREMDQLRWLYCQQNRIATLDPIKALKLSQLYCDDNQIASLAPLRDMKLELLYCGQNQIKDLSPLQGMPIYALNCSHNLISSLDPIVNLPDLSELYCASNQISSLEPLSQSKNLGYLDCSNNRIRTLKPLINQPLYSLDCSQNQLETLEPFVSGAPPETFIFDCDTLPDAEIERAKSAWLAKGRRFHAGYCDLLLALRHDDLGKVRSLAKDFAGRGYLFVQKPMTKAEAEQFCTKFGGHLLTIMSEEEKKFLIDIIIAPPGATCRIGLIVSKGKPCWVTGEEVNKDLVPELADRGLSDAIVTWKGGICLPLPLSEDKPMPFIIEWE